GSYGYALPSIDWSADLTPDTKLRVSFGKTIGRPGWNAIQGGRTLNGLARIDGGSGNVGNPNLKPLQSTNFDLSAEHYYA
ncbi:TonB-dependent receptor, partial [Acinetobacter baumannii]